MANAPRPEILDYCAYSERLKSRCYGLRDFFKGRLHRKFRKDVAILKNFIPEGSLVVDAGSNHGRFSIEVAELYSGTGKCTVHAFEPVTYNYNVQRRILAGLENVIKYNCGLSNISAELDIYIPLRPNGALAHGGGFIASESEFLSRVESRTDRVYVKQKVVCDTLDSILAERDAPVAFIKIDVEGHEFEVLKGATNIFSEDRPTIFIESRGEADPLHFLADQGFHFYDLDLCNDGYWTDSPREVWSHIVDAGKHHDILCWHPFGVVGGEAPVFAIPFAQTRFGE